MTSGRVVYGTGGGITWGSDPAAEQAEVVAKTAVLSVRPLAFELVETVRYVPGRGVLNRHLHLQRLADSAEYLDFHCGRDCRSLRHSTINSPDPGSSPPGPPGPRRQSDNPTESATADQA